MNREPVYNLSTLVSQGANNHPDKVAVIESAFDGDTASRPVTYAELSHAVTALAAFFTDEKITPSKPVAMLFYNTLGFVVVYFALLRLGVPVIPLNTRLTADEINTILTDAEVSHLISNADFDDVLSDVKTPFLKTLWRETQDFTLDFETSSKQKSKIETDASTSLHNIDTLATLIYTSGTTGKPKGVMLSHRNILADATANCDVIEAVPEDVFVTVSPLFHVFGQTNILVSALMSGATVVLVKRFSPQRILKAIDEFKVTFLAAVPTMYQMMLVKLNESNQQKTTILPYDLSSLRVCHSGAAPMPVEVFHRTESVFGAPVQEGYGLSEASSIICSNPLHGTRKAGSVGLGLKGITVKVFDENLNESADNEVGEIHVQGDVVMQGYYRQSELTQQAFVIDAQGERWLKTKDMAYRDSDGYLFIVDRKDDLINIGGVKVYPREIEEVMYRHPAVQSVAVIGRPADLYHQSITAFVVLKQDQTVTVEAIKKHCASHLADYKIPKFVRFVDEIPQGATGKILRKELYQHQLNNYED